MPSPACAGEGIDHHRTADGLEREFSLLTLVPLVEILRHVMPQRRGQFLGDSRRTGRNKGETRNLFITHNCFSSGRKKQVALC